MFKLIKRIPKKWAAAIAATLIIAVPLAVYAGFGPDRPTFDYNKYDPSKSCTDPANAYSRCGSMTGPVFNSFVNTPSYGDERNFARIAPVVAGQSPVDANYTETAQATPGQEYWVRTLVHNDANQNLNGTNNDGISVAKNATIRMAIASGVANGVDIMSYVSAQNAQPQTVWDSATLANSNQSFSVQYENGSAEIFNAAHPTGMTLSDNIMSANGTPLGYNNMDGVFPGCFDFSAYVYVKVMVKSPNLNVTKFVRENGTTTWQDQITANKGDNVQWKIAFQNAGNDVANDVTIRDTLPNGVTLVPGSIKWYDANHNGQPLPDNALNAGGVDLGNYGPAGNDVSGLIVFNTTINNDLPKCELTNIAYGRATNIPEISGSAKVEIHNCQSQTPSFSCVSLQQQAVATPPQTVQFTTTTNQSNGVTVSRYFYDFGDNTPVLTTDQKSVTHTYAQPGNYPASVKVEFLVNGQAQAPVSSNGCMQTVTFPTPPVTLISNQTPTQLVNTGPGNVVGIFFATTVLGAIAHRLFWVRRFGRSL